jgi:hypothetical protein
MGTKFNAALLVFPGFLFLEASSQRAIELTSRGGLHLRGEK